MVNNSISHVCLNPQCTNRITSKEEGAKYCSRKCYHACRFLPKSFCARDGCNKKVPNTTAKFCGKDCMKKGFSARMTKRKNLTCVQCKGTYTTQPCKEETSKFCSRDCQKLYSIHHIQCRECGKNVKKYKQKMGKFCNMVCKKKFTAKNSKRVNLDYGRRWKTQKRKCLTRDNYTCQRCQKTKEELGRNPDVHHKVPFRISRTNRLTNLISLCNSCHKKAETEYIKKHPK